MISFVSECDLDIPSCDRSFTVPTSVRDLVDERAYFEEGGVDTDAVITPRVLGESGTVMVEETDCCGSVLEANDKLLLIGENTPDPFKKEQIKKLIILNKGFHP